MSNSKNILAKAFKSISFAAIFFSATPALAFDDNRQGFILGLGAGFHSTDIDFFYNGSNVESQSESGFATSFKIGGGLTDQLALYYVRNASWYSAPLSNGKDATYTIGLTGLGGSYFLSPSAPSGYFIAAFGIGDYSTPFENIKPDTGSALMFGGGYEFQTHLMFEVTLLTTDIESEYDSRFSLKSSSFQFTLNYLFY